MKRLTLDETWRLCLKMWRWIAKMWREGTKLSVRQLKAQWLLEHGYEDGELDENCFFCEYYISHRGTCYIACPARKIDSGFLCTTHKEYRWDEKPIAFYNKLRSLNRKRLLKKKK